MSLARYREKRDFRRTPEPAGRRAAGKRRLRYVIQKHAARRLHYDVRLELDGALKSWAVPKGPSLDPADKRLAVQVEDHPVDYGAFEGTIPEGQYGAGAIAVWDRGIWVPRGDARKGYRKGHLSFSLRGEKLHGGWSLVRMNGRRAGGKPNWLLIKERDRDARPGDGAKVLDARPESVLSGRTVEELAERPRPGRPQSPPLPAAARKAAFPASITPALATLVAEPPADAGWAYEIKYDGYRLLARIRNGTVTLRTRSGRDWTRRFPRIAKALADLKLPDLWLDGEVCVLDERGVTNFSALQRALRGGGAEPVFVAFDIPFVNGIDLRGITYRQRMKRLAQLLAPAADIRAVRLGRHLAANGAQARAAACKLGLEGLIGKRLDSPYTGGRTRDWIKVKCRQRQEFVIAGYTPPRGTRTAFGALLLGVQEPGGRLRYAGRVGTGFDDATLNAVFKRLRQIETRTPPFPTVPPGVPFRGVHWVRPVLVAEATFTEWTADGIVRQASFVGLREDKSPRAIVRERPTPVDAARPARNRAAASATVSGITITHPDRVLYPGTSITKLDVARYYARVASRLLPYLRNRPVSLLRCPSGTAEGCFFQKHVGAGEIPGVNSVMIREAGGKKPYLIVNSARALIGLTQIGTIELHAWGAKYPGIERPDTMVIDLDPAEGIPWTRVIESARLMRALFDALRLRSFVKTTGGKGLHVVVPLSPRADWTELQAFSRAVAIHVARTFPDRFTVVSSKTARRGKIFLDYLRNARGATAVAPYSLRARPGATIATPLAWSAVTPALRPDRFRIGAPTLARGNPWRAYPAVRQFLNADMRRAVGLRG